MSGTMQQSQRVLMMILPFAFIPFILQFPSGLVLYWMTTNLWTVGQGLITRRLIPKIAPPTAPKRSSRTPPKEAREEVATQQAAAPKPSGPPRRVKRKKKARR
jgi:YidC/Oxa1 family membrane protein insertase